MRKYILKPMIPDEMVSAVIMDFRTDKEALRTLNSLNIEVIPTCKIDSIQDSVCGHADMMIHHFGGGNFVTANEAYDYFKKILPDADFVKGKKRLRTDYPSDILYNTAVFGGAAICNRKFTAPEILKRYDKILDVKQGYAKCSICIVNDNAIITADKKIAQICRQNKIDVLEIEEGYVELKGMNYGFFGGATGLIDSDILALNGELKTHKNAENIKAFCRNYNVDILELKSGIITDIGSILPICRYI